MLTPELETAIRNSLEDATRRGHEFAALEHLLLALLGDEKTAEVVKHCGGSVSRLSDKLEAFLESELKPLPESERERSQPTLAFARVIQRAYFVHQDEGVVDWVQFGDTVERRPRYFHRGQALAAVMRHQFAGCQRKYVVRHLPLPLRAEMKGGR